MCLTTSLLKYEVFGLRACHNDTPITHSFVTLSAT